MSSKAEKNAARILEASLLRPELAVVLGSGFSALRQAVQIAAEIPYCALPGFPPSRVPGHVGTLVVGRLDDVPVLLLCGRAHYYEGYALSDITFPIRVLALCGIRAVLLTNAAGGINPRFRPGDFMCLTDHINFMGGNPLRNRRERPCFLDLSETYAPSLNQLLARAARQARVRLHSGVYIAVSGPCYETPAEIRAFARWGADAVGMSTVPEAIVARRCGLRVAALSCITNPAAGLERKALCHAEVLAKGEQVKTQATALVTRFARLTAEEAPRG